MDLIPSPHPTPSKALQLQPAYQANEADPKHMPEACFPGRRLKNVRFQDREQHPGAGRQNGGNYGFKSRLEITLSEICQQRGF